MLVILAVLLFFTTASATIYATQPTSETVWSAGRTVNVTWKDDKTRPLLKNIGPLRIDLYMADDAFVATLAEDVLPQKKTQQIQLSPTWGRNGSDYHLRFICTHPPLTVYTADFALTPMSSLALTGDDKTATATLTATGSLYTPVLTLVLPNATITSTLPPTNVRSSSTATATPNNRDGNGYVHGEERARSGVGASISRRVDVERMKFRVVFIMWPVLMGLSMAL